MAAFLPKNTTSLAKPPKQQRPTLKLVLKISIGLLMLFIISLMFPSSASIEITYKVGSVWSEDDLISPFSFPILKDQKQYEMEVQEAKSKVYKVFLLQDRIAADQLAHLKILLSELRTFINIQKQSKLHFSENDSVRLKEIYSKYSNLLTEYNLKILERNFNWIEIETVLSDQLEQVFARGVLDQKYKSIANNYIALRKGTVEVILPATNYYDLDSALQKIDNKIFEKFGENNLSSLLIQLVPLVLKPNVIYSPTETDKLISAAIEMVPRTLGYVAHNERIVSKYERITQDTKLKLESLRQAKAEQQAGITPISENIGVILQVAVILMLYSIYLYLFRKRIFHDNSKLLLIAIVLLMQVTFAYISTTLSTTVSLQYLIFVPASAMLLTIIFDSRVAYYGTVVMAFLVAGVRGNDYEIALASLVAGALAAYTVRDIRQRTQIFRSMVFIFIGYALTITAFGLQRGEIFISLLQDYGFALANAIFSPVLTYGLLIFFERSFKITTDLTLVELTDPNHPLLRMLREKTPGTYHHSMMIGNLAETAADAINANTVLARVGAYYHDIGKTIKPEYFAENEFQKKSRHQKLTPRMSARIIIMHVKEGIETARDYSLPEAVIDFIPQHHGTTRISFFFDKALKLAAAGKTRDEVRDEDYRYPGPKPQSKETAIVMLADIVEAYTRTLSEFTPERLEAAIDDRIKMRFIEGQLDECDLTLRDLTKIKEAFLKILIGTYHQRIKYPEQIVKEEIPEATTNEAENIPDNSKQEGV